jgi:hypothetical protein
MENEADDAVRRKWDEQARAQVEEMQQAGKSSRKRQRGAISFLNTNEDHQNFDQSIDGTARKDRNAPMPKAGSSKAPAGSSRASAPRAAAATARAKTKTLFPGEDDSRIEELD